MGIEKELYYQEFIRRETSVLRAPYNPELEFYSIIKAGDVKRVTQLCRQAFIDKTGFGTLSENPLRNIKYHFVISTSIIARYCVEGGLDVSIAYGLSDFYIQKADHCQTAKEVSDLHPVMCLDYANRMKHLRTEKVCSKPIADCIDYIYEHLHTRMTLKNLALYLDVTPSYLSRLFKKEMGITISLYIQNLKIETAQNMLIHSEYTASQISSTLAFPSQSYFTEIFRKRTGMSPKKFRGLYFRSVGMHPRS